MRFCNRCLYPSKHPLNIIFDEKGICSGCRIHEEKDTIDWDLQKLKLSKILNQYRNLSGNNYDCIIPVSGARDSYFIVHTIKNVYKMNPLLVSYNKQFSTDIGVRNLANLRIKFDCDIMTLTVDPHIIKKITRATIDKMGSIYWHCIAGQTVYPVQVAVKFKIPLIIWGVHQGIDQVGMFSHLDEVEMTRKYRKEHDLMGYEAEDLIDDDFNFISEDDVTQFVYPEDKEIEQVGVRGIYLGNYIRWDSKQQHEEMIRKFDYETTKANRTFDTYNDIDCYNYNDVHDYIKFIKHGYGKVIDHASREIRLKRMTREQGILLAKKYLNFPPKNLKLFLEWIGISENSFNNLIDQHRNRNIWKRNEKWEWEPYFPDFNFGNNSRMIEEARLISSKKKNNFQITNKKISSDHKGKYILIGKGL